jgi:hypothetical protein
MAIEGRAAKTSYEATAAFDVAVNNALVEVGEKFGLYAILGSIGPATEDQVAACTGITGAQLGHWLHDQATAGYLDYDESSHRYSTWCDINRN